MAQGMSRAKPLRTTLRQKKCKACPTKFLPSRGMQIVCSPLCAARFAAVQRAKAEHRALVQARASLKSRGKWMAEAQAAFNAFIRARDAGKPCICCGRFSLTESRGGEFDAGHYRSRGAAPHLRFDERNVHAQLKHCNRYAFDVAAFRAGLVQRIGLAEVELLESDNGPRRYSIDDLREIKRGYTLKARDLRQQASKPGDDK